MDDQGSEDLAAPVLRVTDAARAFIVEQIQGEASPSELALYIEVSGVSGGTFTYEMWFETLADAGANDVIQHHDDLVVVVFAASVAALNGATLDLGDGGLFITNPNAPPADPAHQHFALPESDLSGPVEQAVLYVLEHEVNPQIAAHGGRADLVAVDEEGVAYLRLSGGCQGCGLATVTLSQGISVAIKDAVPQITDVRDVTDHEHGDSPYFEGAKK